MLVMNSRTAYSRLVWLTPFSSDFFVPEQIKLITLAGAVSVRNFMLLQEGRYAAGQALNSKIKLAFQIPPQKACCQVEATRPVVGDIDLVEVGSKTSVHFRREDCAQDRGQWSTFM